MNSLQLYTALQAFPVCSREFWSRQRTFTSTR